MLTSLERLYLESGYSSSRWTKGKAKLLEPKDGKSPDPLNPICQSLRTLTVGDSRSLPNQEASGDKKNTSLSQFPPVLLGNTVSTGVS